MNETTGTLFVVATPIGNLADLSARAGQVLADASLVAAEDTRRTGQLLTSLGLSKRLLSFHEHNETQRVEEIIAALLDGQNVALVSDAGTPLISDPGYRLLAAVGAAGLRASPIPGPSAILAALSVAGLATDRFRFEGFLPARSAARRQRLSALANVPDTLIFFESVHRIDASLADCAEVLGAGRQAALARELTKRHETIYRGDLATVRVARAADSGGGRGEFTLVVAGNHDPAAGPEAAEIQRVLALLSAELPPGKAAALTARITGARRAEVYRMANLSPAD